MKLDAYCERFDRTHFPDAREHELPERASVQEARAALADAVVDDEFLADCMARELVRLAEDRMNPGLAPFHTVDGLGIRMAFGYWPPGATAGPHEHTSWTITAVCRNELHVATFDRDASYRGRTLVPKHRFEATAGRTGFIYEPCIHEPWNPTADWSLSFHVLSPHDGEKLGDYSECIPALVGEPLLPDLDHPYARVLAVRGRHRYVGLLARILAPMEIPCAGELLGECARLGSSATRRMIGRRAADDRPTGGGMMTAGREAVPWILERTHPDLVLDCRSAVDLVALHAESPAGMVEELTIGNAARETIAAVAREPMFDVRSLPGNFSEEERAAIAQTLEDTGLFRRTKA